MRGGSLLLFFALVLFFPLPSDQIGGGFFVLFFFSFFSSLCFLGCSDGMEREACVCDHGFERSDLCAEIIIIIIIIIIRLDDAFAAVVLQRGTEVLHNEIVQRIFPSHVRQQCGVILLYKKKRALQTLRRI